MTAVAPNRLADDVLPALTPEAEHGEGRRAVEQLLEAAVPEHRALLDEAIAALATYCDLRERLAAKTAKLEQLRRKARCFGLPVPPADSFALRGTSYSSSVGAPFRAGSPSRRCFPARVRPSCSRTPRLFGMNGAEEQPARRQEDARLVGSWYPRGTRLCLSRAEPTGAGTGRSGGNWPVREAL